MAKLKYSMDFRKGTFIDSVSKTAGIVTLGASGGIKNSEKGKCFYGLADSYVQTGILSNAVGSANVAIECRFKPSNLSATVKYIYFSTRSVGSTFMSVLRVNSKIKLYFANNAGAVDTTAVESTTDIKIGQRYHVVATREGTSNVKLYVNGVLEDSATTGGQASSAHNIFIGAVSGGTFPLNGSIGLVNIYETLSQTEIDKLYANFLKASNLELTKRNFRKTNEEITGDEVNLSDAFQFTGEEMSKVVSKRGGAITQSGTPTLTNEGLLIASTNPDYLTTTYSFASKTKFTIEMVARRTIASNRFGVYHYVTANSNCGLLYGGDQYIYFSVTDGSPSYGYCATNDLQFHHIVGVYDGSGTGNTGRMQIYIDGVLQTLTFLNTIPASVAALSGTTKIGLTAIGTNHNGVMKYCKIYTNKFTQADVTKSYNNYAKQVNVSEKLSYAGADGVVTNPREWTIQNGTRKVGEDTAVTAGIRNIGDKYITDATVGGINLPMNFAYGTLEFDFYKTDTTGGMIITLGDIPGVRNTTGLNGYYIYINSSEEILFGKSTAGTIGALVFTASGYFENTKRYRLKVTRTTTGVWTAYIKGGNFGTSSWTLMTMTGNPFTDNTFNSMKYINISTLTTAGNRIGNIKLSQGVLPN